MVDTRGALLSLVYSSKATQPFSADDLTALHTLSRRNNAASQLTGLLLHRDGRFVQVLEGPEGSVRERMSVIEADTRHTDVLMLTQAHVDRRRFPDWAMEYRPLGAAMVDTIPGYDAVFTGLDRPGVTAAEVELPLEVLMRWYEARAGQAW